jgi:SM-20-related protein
VVVLLSEQSEQPAPGTYCGGALVLHGPVSGSDPAVSLAPAPGTLVAFPSETTHEVAPVTHGERLSIVSWYRCEREDAPA